MFFAEIYYYISETLLISGPFFKSILVSWIKSNKQTLFTLLRFFIIVVWLAKSSFM